MANATPHLLPRGERLLQGTISSALSDSATEVDVSNPPSVSELPTYVELDPGTDDAETIRIYDVSSNTIYFDRGVYNSGVGIAHDPNAPYKQKITSQHWKKVVDAIEAGYMPEDASVSLVRDSATQFTLEGIDRTAFYIDERIIRFNGSDSLTAVVESSVLTTGDTVVTLKTGLGTIPSPLNTVELAIQPKGYVYPFSKLVDVQLSNAIYDADEGAADAYEVTLSPAVTAYQAGLQVLIKFSAANTGACTLEVNSLGTKSIKVNVDEDPKAGLIKADMIGWLVYDGTNFQLLSLQSVQDGAVDLVDGAEVEVDASLGSVFKLSAEGDREIQAPTNPYDGQKIIIVHHASGGARTLSLETGAGGFLFGADITEIDETESGKRDLIGCVYNLALERWLVVAFVKGFSTA